MRVLLVHGLGRTRRSFFLLRRRLVALGHTPECFSYSASRERHDAVVERLAARLRSLAAVEPEVGLVGHSFGGLLLRQGIALTPEVTVRHLIMLGTPNRPPHLARVVYPYLPQRIHVGTCRACLVDDTWFQRLPALRVPYTVVAGTAGWRGSLSPFKGKGNDGLVQVSETLVKDDDHPVLVPTIHSLLMNNARVHRLIIEKFEPV